MIINSNIKSGKNTLSNLPDYLKELDLKCPLVLVDKKLYDSSNYVKRILDETNSDKFILFYDYPFEPSYQMLDKMMAQLKNDNLFIDVDVVIGIGGGSTMDTAKGLAILLKNPGQSIEYKGFPTKLNDPLPVIAIPSTTGTGSEVVYNASFIDEKSKIKMGINYYKNYPILSILDPLVPSTAPISVLASSGSDALVHALESFMSTETNEQVRFFSKKAYSLIIANMIPILEGYGEVENWENMQWAAVYAMYALSNSTSGPTGALSYYLGTHFKVNHGVAGGAFIGKICRYNHENEYYDLSELYQREDQINLSNKEKSSLVVEEIENILMLSNIPQKLSQFGVKKSDLNGFNEFAVQAKAAMDYNPVNIETSRVGELFIKI